MLVGDEALDLRLTLIDSAQCFRWVERDGRFGCVMDGRAVWLHREDDGIHAEGAADREALRWENHFKVDCVCGNDRIYLISGTSR